jgi:hypothetical protein
MNKKIATALSALERNMGIDFVLDLYDDFLATDAFASYAGFRDRLTAAYADASPEWADIIRGQADVYCDPAARQAAYHAQVLINVYSCDTSALVD